MALALRVGAKRLIFTHHEPTRSDDALEAIFTEVQARYPGIGCELMLAREGMEILL